MFEIGYKLFKCDITANNARWFHRVFWFYFFLRGGQYIGFAPIKCLFKLCKKIVLAGACCELPASAIVGGGVYIPHMNGIVISPYARIEDNVTNLQQVTLGVDFEKDPFTAPQVGKGVFLGAGSKVIGDVKLGDGCKVGANAVVTRDVPAGRTVVGANILL